MRYAIGLNSFQKYIPTVLASDVSDETVAAIMENLDQMDGVDIAEDSLRRYTDSKYFASIKMCIRDRRTYSCAGA